MLTQHKRRRRAHVSKRGVHPEHRKKVSSRGGCDGRYEKKYEKKYEYSRFLLLFAAETRFAGLLSHADECCCCYRSTPHYRSRSLKMKSARFKKASQEIGEIGVPRGKKSERYRSTAHGQTDRRQFIQVQSFSLPMVGPPEQYTSHPWSPSGHLITR